MSDNDKAAFETTALRILNEKPYISYAAVNIGTGDVLNVWIVPTHLDQPDISDSITISTVAFVEGRHFYPDLSKMSLTLGSDERTALGIAYCLGSWADTVRFEDGKPNGDDIIAVAEKVMGTMKDLQ